MSNKYIGEFISYGKTLEYSSTVNNKKYSKKKIKEILEKIDSIILENLIAYREKCIEDKYMDGFLEYSYVSLPFFATFVKDYIKKFIEKSDCSFSLAFDKAVLEYMKKPERNFFWDLEKVSIQETYNENITRLKNSIRKQIDRFMLNKMIEDYKEDLVIVVNNFEKEFLHNLPINVVGFVCKNLNNFELIRDLSFAYEIPIVVVNKNVSSSEYLLIDCLNNVLYVDPKVDIVTKALNEKRQYTFSIGESPKYTSQEVNFYANIVDRRDFEKAGYSSWYTGVGLFRSEYYFITKGYMPTFDDQVELYSDLLKAFHDRPVHIRIPDFNDIKTLDYEDNIQTELDSLHKFNRIFLTNVQAIYEASRINNKQVTIYVPMLRVGKEIDRWKHRFDGFLGIGLPVEIRPKFGIMMETESAMLYYEDYRDADSIVFGLNDFLEEAMEVSRYDKVDFEDFMLQVFPDLQGAHQYFRRNGIKKLHIVSGNVLKQTKILRKLIKKGFKHFCIPLSYIKVAEEELFKHESTRGKYVGVHADRKKNKSNK